MKTPKINKNHLFIRTTSSPTKLAKPRNPPADTKPNLPPANLWGSRKYIFAEIFSPIFLAILCFVARPSKAVVSVPWLLGETPRR